MCCKTICRSVHPAGPAGSIISSAVDMSKWIQYHLRQLQNMNTQSDTLSNIIDTYGRQTVDPCRGLYMELDRSIFPVADKCLSYGMGWIDAIYRGKTVCCYNKVKVIHCSDSGI